MCARYSLTKGELTILIGEVELIINVAARYNIAPTQIIPAIVNTPRGPAVTEMRWGFQSAWSPQPLINAKAETIKTTAFNKYLTQRCLIPADGFYEWTADKAPIRFTPPDEGTFCFAGLWQEVNRPGVDLEIKERRCVILTTTPNATVGRVHDRMPFRVQAQHYDWWLEEDGLYEQVLNFPDRSEYNWLPVNRALNNARNEGAELIRPAPIQKELF
jgi:putative SOS response-associated peptidase YedK